MAEKKEKKYVSDNAQLIVEWNWEKNNELNFDPKELTLGSNKKVWWKCSFCSHEWKSTVNHRANGGTGCPICAKYKAASSKVKTHAQTNSLLTNFPNIAKEWHPSKNLPLTSKNVSACSNIKVWWKCSFCSHEWETTINHRTNGRGCPKCSKSGTSRCEQIIYYYIQKAFPDAINRYFKEFEFDVFIPSRNVAIEYDGFFFHKDNQVYERDNKKDIYCDNHGIKLIRFRSSRLKDTVSAQRITCEDYEIEKGIQQLFYLLHSPCPTIDLDADSIKVLNNFRATRKRYSIAENYPKIAVEWHPTKNGDIPADCILPMSNIKFWWKCLVCGYEWKDTPNHRCARNSGCPVCAGKTVIEGFNDLSTQYPQIANEWNYEKNGALRPSQVASSSNIKVWWKCSIYQHEWEAKISDRTRTEHRTSCPYCGNKKVLKGFNDLTTTHPHLAIEWSASNSFSPSEITYGSKKKPWWKCRLCGHEWQTYVYSRSKGCGCPKCAKKSTN